MLIEKTNDDVPVEDRVGAIYRAYAYSALLNYFGGTPIIVTVTPQGDELRNSEDEVRDFIIRDCDEAYTMLPSSSGIRYVAQQIKARTLLGGKDFAGAANALQEIINSGIYSLQHEALMEGIDMELPEAMQKGTQSYLFRYTETLLMYAEAQTELGNTGKAAEIVNQIAEAQGLSPTLSPSATQEQCREVIHSFWTNILDREGHEFARLKRTGKFMETLGQYGAQSRHQLLPIPAPELYYNPNMTQNPGW
jgi:hypothetical protein